MWMSKAAEIAGLLLILAVAYAYIRPVVRFLMVAVLPNSLCGPGGRWINTAKDAERRRASRSHSIGGMFVWFGNSDRNGS